MKTLPKFVTLGGLALRRIGEIYFRDAGTWEVRFDVVDDKIMVNEPSKDWLDKQELVPCTYQEWHSSNEGYTGGITE